MRIRNLVLIVSFAAVSLLCSSTSEKSESAENTGDATKKESTDTIGNRSTGDSCTPGCKSGNCTNGTGVFVYEVCDEYNGWFVDGKRSGTGEFRYKNGDRFLGNF